MIQVLSCKSRHVQNQYGPLRGRRPTSRSQQRADKDRRPNPDVSQSCARARGLAIAPQSTGYEALIMPKVGFEAY